ncbi:hypothetical protein COV25_02055 [candidate division WWE3 bacterium CG10_big_fil_rev_8_21_14_0_10_35_32]|nr:MAG: hypothetical protein COV25_02055 [candidate division WWE3 bacterium CG10_big_fil_rev_8_21_14_0_10_35_32]
MNSIRIVAKKEEIIDKVLKFVSKFSANDVSVELPDTVADLSTKIASNRVVENAKRAMSGNGIRTNGRLASAVLSESAIKRYGRMIKDFETGKNVYKFETTSKAMDFLMSNER